MLQFKLAIYDLLQFNYYNCRQQTNLYRIFSSVRNFQYDDNKINAYIMKEQNGERIPFENIFRDFYNSIDT